MPDLSDFVTTEEAARMLKFHVEHVRRLLREGDLQGAKMGTAWLVLKKSVEEYIRDRGDEQVRSAQGEAWRFQ